MSVLHAECPGLPRRSGSALLSGWLDRRKRHALIYRGPIPECGGEGPPKAPIVVHTTSPDHISSSGSIVVCVIAGLVRLAGAEYGGRV